MDVTGHSCEEVLLVDDDADVRTVAAMSLEASGRLRVTRVATSHEARMVLSRRMFPLILVDLHLGGEDGAHLIEWIRQRPDGEQAAVVVFSADAPRGDHHEWTRLGVSGVIAKPFDPCQLENLVERHLVAHRSKIRSVSGAMDHTSEPRPSRHVKDKMDRLWRAHRESLVSELVLLSGFLAEVPGLEGDGTGAAQRRRVASEAAHRIHGALGIYGFTEESTAAGTLHTLLRDELTGVHHDTMRNIVEEIRRSING